MSKEKKASAFVKGLAVIDSIKMLAAWTVELICIVGSGITATAAVLFVIDQQMRAGIIAALIAVILILIPVILTVTTGANEQKDK